MTLAKNLLYSFIGEDKSASSTMEKMQAVAEKTTGKIGGAFSSIGSKVGGEFGEILNKAGEGISQIGEHTGKMSAVVSVGGGVITGLGAALQQMGSADKQASDQLKQSIENTGHSYEGYHEEIEKTIAKQEDFGHSAVDTETALRKMTQATNDPKKGFEEMGLAANLAAARHESLSEAADQLDKIMAGKGGKTLAEYGIKMGKVVDPAKEVTKAQAGVQKSSDQLAVATQKLSDLQAVDAAKKKLSVADHLALKKAQDNVTAASSTLAASQEWLAKKQEEAKHPAEAQTAALEQLSKKLDGQANASMDNFGAKVNAIRVKLTDWAASVGNQVGPALTTLGPILMATGAAMEIFKTISGAVKAAQLAQTAATEAGAVAQRGFNLAMLANPIVLVIAAIVALVAGLVWFFTQTKLGQQIWHNFTQFLADAWNWLWTAVLKPVFTAIGAIFNWLWSNIVLPIVTLIGLELRGLGIIFNWLWNTIIQPVALWIGNAVRLVGQAFSVVFGGIGNIIRGAFGGVGDFIRSQINGVIDVINLAIGGINGLISLIDKIPGVSVPQLGRLPHLALGGIATKPTVALIGESGPEAVVPLNSGGRYGGGGGSLTIQVDVHAGAVGSEQHLARTVTTALVNAIRQGAINKQEIRTALGV